MKYFKISEFDSPDLKGSGERMQASTLSKLDRARDLAGVPFKITSAYRTKEHNKKVGGVSGSAHLLGYAVDIATKNPSDRFKILWALFAVGFRRVGIAKSYIHADDDPSKPSGVVWLY